MKNIITLLAFTLSLGAFAQERVILNSSKVDAPSATAILVRTSQTPDKVEVRFNNIQMYGSVCYERYTETRTCYRNETVRHTRQVCRDVVVTVPDTTPRGPRYNNPSSPRTRTERRRECKPETIVSTRSVPYNCSYTECRYKTEPVGFANDKVKIKFKNLPRLGGTEEETFRVTATQNSTNGSNIVYSIIPESVSHGYQYEVKKKGILGFDSFVIQTK